MKCVHFALNGVPVQSVDECFHAGNANFEIIAENSFSIFESSRESMVALNFFNLKNILSAPGLFTLVRRTMYGSLNEFQATARLRTFESTVH